MGKIVGFVKNHTKLSVLFLVIFVVVGFFGYQQLNPKGATTPITTATVAKGTLVVSVAESGQMASANRLPITTQASGQIKQVFVKNGEHVTAGQNILVLSLDQTGQQRSSSAWSAYLQSQSSLTAAQNALYSLQSTMFTNWQKYMDTAQSSSYQNSDNSPNTANRQLTPFTITQDNWLSSQAVYTNQQNIINQSQVALSNAWLNYQGSSATVTAPGDGIVSDIVLTPGMAITSTTNSSNVANTTTVGSIVTNNLPTAIFNLSEIDVTKVKEGQKATLTLDALPGMTFTGTVIGINRSGLVTSNVTNYPVTIQFDTSPDNVLPNMSVNASIITNTKDNILVVPTAAIRSGSVRVQKNGNIQTVTITTGIASDTETEIVSGLSEGDVVITGGGVAATTTTGSTGSSPFGGALRFGGGGSGGTAAVRGRGG